MPQIPTSTTEIILSPKQALFVHSQAKFPCMAGGFNNGKCVAAGSKITTKRGRIPIQDILPGDMALTFTEDHSATWKPVKNVLDTGMQPGFRIRLRGGHSVVVSMEHPFLVARLDKNHKVQRNIKTTEWVQTQNLVIGDRIAVPAYMPMDGDDIPYSWLIGVLIGDGCLRKDAVFVSIGQNELKEKIETHIPDTCTLTKTQSSCDYRIGRTKGGRYSGHNNTLLDIVRKYPDIDNKLCYDKRIPPEWWNASQQSVIDILSGIFVTDGWVDRQLLGISLSNEELINDIRVLLLSIGVYALKCTRNIKYKGETRHSWCLSVTHQDDFVNALSMDLMWKNSRLQALADQKQESKNRGRNKQWKYKDLCFQPLRSIEDVGPVHMYDLEIEDTHCFVADEIIVHNTYASCVRALLWTTNYPGCRGLIGRLTYQELEDSTQKQFLDLLPPWALDKKYGAVFRKNEGFLQLPNKSEIVFRHMDAVSEFELRSMNLTWFYIDQAEEVPEEVFLALVGRIGRTQDSIGKPSGWISANPAPGWVYERFKATPWPDTELIEATTYDNPRADPQYIETLRQLYPKAWFDRYVLGRWDVFEGQVFTNFGDEHIKEPPPEDEWPPDAEIICGMDHGLDHPTAAVWGFVDWAGRLWIFDEYEEREQVVSVNVAAIVKKSARFKRVHYVMDPSTTRRDPKDKQRLIDEYFDHFPLGTDLTPANCDVDAGIARLLELFAFKGIFISPACKMLIKRLRAYHWKKKRPGAENDAKDEPAKVKDDLVDSLRYLVMTRPAPPKPRVVDSRALTFDKAVERIRSQRLAQSLIGRGGIPIG